jgi:hypothetical protein
MMRVMSAAVLAAALVAGAAAPLPALAKSAGTGCVWRTSFSGARDTGFVHFQYQWYRAAPCFASLASCKAWLYKTQTAYPYFMDFVPCHKGKR